MWTEERGWYSAEASVKKPHEIELTGDDEVRFLLLGGNYGNVGFRVMDTPE